VSDQRYVRRRPLTEQERATTNALLSLATWTDGALDFDFVRKLQRASHITEKQSRRLRTLAEKHGLVLTA
jgi:hypothetical protein